MMQAALLRCRLLFYNTDMADNNKPSKINSYGKLIYGFLGIIVSVISIVVTIVYNAGIGILISAITLLAISVIILVAGLNERKQ